MKISRFAFIVPLVASTFAACAEDDRPVHDHLASCDHELVAVPAAPEIPRADDTSYLAIPKDVVDNGWLSSASVDPAARLPFAATEMVWLRLQRDRVFVFVSGPRPRTGVIDPPKLRASYPIVQAPELGQPAGANRYVFVEIPAVPSP